MRPPCAAPASKEASGPGEVDPAPAQGGAKGSVFGALNASKKESLFDDDDDVTETAAAAPRISVNKEYASRHAHNKKREELHRLQEKYGADYDPDASGSSSSDTEDEDAEALTRTVEKDFFSTLAKLKSNHPSIRDPKKTFFAEPTSDDDGESNIAGTKRDKKAKPFNLRDHERMRLETKGELAFVSDDEGEEAELAGKSKSLAFDAEQRKLRQSLVKSLHGAAEADEGSAEDGEADDFFRVRGKTSEEQEAEDADYAKWLRDEGALDQEEAQELEPLRRFWTDPNLSEADRFLRDYITNRKWRSDEPSARAVPRYDEVIGTGGPAQAIDLDEDEEHVEQMEEFEQGYNFRFQEEGATEIEWFPRDIEGSLRKKKNKRQEARLRASERREEEKVTKSEEIKRLKNLKKEEILNKLKQLQDLSGHAAGGLEAIDLEGEFDPEEYAPITLSRLCFIGLGLTLATLSGMTSRWHRRSTTITTRRRRTRPSRSFPKRSGRKITGSTTRTSKKGSTTQRATSTWTQISSTPARPPGRQWKKLPKPTQRLPRKCHVPS